jgi:phenylacetate-CoA ligase
MIKEGVCPCGRTHVRLEDFYGRTDDMLIIRGVNVFPTQIEEMVLQHGQLSGQYQLIVTRQGPLDEMQVLCELMSEHAGADRAAIAGALQQRIKTMIGVSTTVSVGAPESIERTLVGKARRVIDKRPK